MDKNVWRQCKSKARYRDEHTANWYRRKCEQKRGTKLDYYWCGYCKGYHLTSRVYVYNLSEEDKKILSVAG